MLSRVFGTSSADGTVGSVTSVRISLVFVHLFSERLLHGSCVPPGSAFPSCFGSLLSALGGEESEHGTMRPISVDILDHDERCQMRLMR